MERNSKYLLLGILILFASQSAVESSMPIPPPQSGFQGVLRDAAGNPLQGTYNVTFRLFDAEVGGNEILVDSHVGVDAIQINGGLLGTTIGGGVVSDGSGPGVFATLPDAYREHGRMFLEIEIEGETLAPRIPLTSAPYSQLSGKTNYVDVDPYLQLVWESPSQIRVEAGSLGFPDGRTRETAMDLTWDFANGVGELGLDTGMEQADTWYYLYAVPSAEDDEALTVVASPNEPATAGGAGPVGYGTSLFLGSFKNDAFSNVQSFDRIGTRVLMERFRVFDVCTGSIPQVDTWTEIDVSTVMPATAQGITVNGFYDSFGSARINFAIAPTAGPIGTGFCVQNSLGSSSRCESTIALRDGKLYYLADLVAGSNDASQCTIFDIRAYDEDVTRY